MQAIGGLAGIVSLVCWIMTLIKMFGSPNGGTGKGIVGIICGLYALIWGWQFVEETKAKNVMIAWTIAIVVGVAANMAGGMPKFH